MQKSALYEAIKALIDQGRLTGVTTDLKLDGIGFVADDDDTIDPTPVQTWNDDGTSVARSEYGGVQIKGVEDLRAQLLNSGDPKQQRVAHALPQFYVFPNDEGLDDRQEYFARENHNVVFVTRALIGLEGPVMSAMTEYSPRWFEKGTRNPVYSYNTRPTDPDVEPNPLGSNPGKFIPNHRLAVSYHGAQWTPDLVADWAKSWVNQFIRTGVEPIDGIGSNVER